MMRRGPRRLKYDSSVKKVGGEGQDIWLSTKFSSRREGTYTHAKRVLFPNFTFRYQAFSLSCFPRQHNSCLCLVQLAPHYHSPHVPQHSFPDHTTSCTSLRVHTTVHTFLNSCDLR